MTQSMKVPSSLHLASTSCSIDIEESDKQDKVMAKSKGKKRIGRYSFYLKHLIGSGYGGCVYKGIRDNLKNTWYAIKVIKIKDMKLANSYLLSNQISILQELDHPSVIKFVDVLYSPNHCYLITEYCEGGNLQKYAQHKQVIQWGSIIHQLSQGCQYLASKNIVHRDLKPANIFLKNGIWKIGDFGFSKKISHSGALIIQSYKVGSPLYMPLQTLQRNMYSIKSDSFALGVIIYQLICKEFPYYGQDMSQLIRSIKEKQLDFTKLDMISVEIVSLIKGLCNSDMKSRLQISETDFSIFLTHKSIEQIETGLQELKPKITQQVILCEFINYLMKNSVYFLEDDHVLYSLISSNLFHLTSVFRWDESQSLSNLKKQYILPNGSVKITDELYRKILKAIQSTVNILKFRQDSLLYQVAIQKLLEYYQIVQSIIQADLNSLLLILKNITLHQNFKNLIPNSTRIKELMASVTIQ